MRTTVEIPDEQRARLLDIAARRGKKGFSNLIQEALESYLRDQNKDEAVQRALRLRGALTTDEADELAQSCESIRSRWR